MLPRPFTFPSPHTPTSNVVHAQAATAFHLTFPFTLPYLPLPLHPIGARPPPPSGQMLQEVPWHPARADPGLSQFRRYVGRCMEWILSQRRIRCPPTIASRAHLHDIVAGIAFSRYDPCVHDVLSWCHGVEQHFVIVPARTSVHSLHEDSPAPRAATKRLFPDIAEHSSAVMVAAKEVSE